MGLDGSRPTLMTPSARSKRVPWSRPLMTDSDGKVTILRTQRSPNSISGDCAQEFLNSTDQGGVMIGFRDELARGHTTRLCPSATQNHNRSITSLGTFSKPASYR